MRGYFRKHFPSWDYTAEPVDFRSLAIFARDFETPPESPEYTSDVQHDLLQAWLTATFLGLPAPLLVLTSSSWSGKTTLATGLSIVFMDSRCGLCPPIVNKKNIQDFASKAPIFGIDHVHNPLTPSIERGIIAAVLREGDKQITANLMLTTRRFETSVKERVIADFTLPIFMQNITENSLPDRILLEEVFTNRDGLLVSLAHRASKLLNTDISTSTRFPDFEKLTTVSGWLPAWWRAQGVLPQTPLVTALEAYMKKHRQLTGSATQIIAALRQDGARGLDFIGQGKARMSAMREALEIIDGTDSSIQYTESTRNGGPYFRLKYQPQHANSESLS